MEIFVVAHSTYLDENVFFSKMEDAQQYMDAVRRDRDLDFNDSEDWWIVSLEEGVTFDAEDLPCVRKVVKGVS